MFDVTPASPRKLLFVLHGAIGDVVRALPLASRIKAHWPDTRIGWGVEPLCEELVRGHPAVDDVFVFERKRKLPGFADYVRQLRAQHFELVLDLQRHMKSGATSRLTGSKRRIGFHPGDTKELNWLFNSEYIREAGSTILKYEHYQYFGDTLGLPPAAPLDFGLASTPDERANVESVLAEYHPSPSRLDGKLICMLMGSTWKSRLWLPERFAAVATSAYERRGLTSVLVGSGADRDFAVEVARLAAPGSTIEIAGRTRLRDLIALFERSFCSMGPDCGPMHISAAVGLPTISLWGSTSPKRSGPFGSLDLMLQSAVGCSPCYRRVCPGLDTLCMRSISSDAVLARIEQILARSQPDALQPRPV